jgi:hypothetical protein
MVVAHHQRERRTCGICTLCCKVLKVDVGIVEDDEIVITKKSYGASGLTYQAIKIKREQVADFIGDAKTGARDGSTV